MSGFEISSKWPGKCGVCGQRYAVGERVSKGKDGKWGHARCINGGGGSARVEVAVPEPPSAPVVDEKPFEPSKYQAAFYDAIRSGSGNYVVIAAPGSGKTTSIRHSVPYLPSGAKVAALAFNKRNAVDLQKAMGQGIHASTFHSLGLSNVKKTFPDIKVEKDKTWKILDSISRDNLKYVDAIDSDGSAIRHLVDLSRNTMSNDLEEISEHYGISFENAEIAYAIARLVMRKSEENTDMADFSDMLYWCATGKVTCEKFDFFLWDELQDANQVQIEVAKLSLENGGRVFGLGDPRQALYAWSGSAIDSVDQVTRHHHAKNLPLSVTYRMPTSHIQYVNQRFPEAGIEARPNAPEGEIGNIAQFQMVNSVEDGDLVICRVNAPLVEPAFELIRQGRKAIILGRDIGKGLDILLSKIEKRNRGASVSELIRALRVYTEKEVAKLEAAKKMNQANTVADQCETIIALSDGCDTAQQIREKISEVFSDNLTGVIFSSIHRSKGGEAKNVYLLRPDLCPHPLAREEWQKAGEQNCLFVALTRSKHGLYFVSDN